MEKLERRHVEISDHRKGNGDESVQTLNSNSQDLSFSALKSVPKHRA